MSAAFSFCVLGAPVPYERATPIWAGGKQRMVTPKRSRAYRKLVRTIASLRVPPGWELTGKFRMAFRFYVLSDNDGDCDNYVKNVKDALKRVAYRDDKQVCGYDECERIVDAARPRAEVTVRRL